MAVRMAPHKGDPAGRRVLFASLNSKACANDGFHYLQQIDNHFAKMPSGGCE